MDTTLRYNNFKTGQVLLWVVRGFLVVLKIKPEGVLGILLLLLLLLQ